MFKNTKKSSSIIFLTPVTLKNPLILVGWSFVKIAPLVIKVNLLFNSGQ